MHLPTKKDKLICEISHNQIWVPQHRCPSLVSISVCMWSLTQTYHFPTLVLENDSLCSAQVAHMTDFYGLFLIYI